MRKWRASLVRTRARVLLAGVWLKRHRPAIEHRGLAAVVLPRRQCGRDQSSCLPHSHKEILWPFLAVECWLRVMGRAVLGSDQDHLARGPGEAEGDYACKNHFEDGFDYHSQH